MKSMIGKQQRVLIERVDGKGMARGYGEHYLPMHFHTGDQSRNRFEDIILEKVVPGETPFISGSIK
jgi:threonylcarbamoyladenosine tRNA methylthiotransferase MtaB